MQLADDATAHVPDKVLVIETRGEPRDFVGAAARLGFDLLGDIDDFEIELDQGEVEEYDRIGRDPHRKGHLYLSATDTRALQEFVRLWRRYDNGETIPGEYTGLRTLFQHAHDIRFWGPKDRVAGTGIEQFVAEALERADGRLLVEIELWYRNDPERRARALAELTRSLPVGVEVRDEHIREAIHYHGVLLDTPIPTQTVEAQWLQADAVMRARPAMQLCVVPGDHVENAIDEEPANIALQQRALPTRPPVVALLDGMPIANHEALAGRIVIDDPLGWDDSIQVRDRRHGTSMASAIVHGDLSSTTGTSLASQLYARPILRPDGMGESMPTDRLPVDLLAQAIDAARAAYPTLSVFNLSIGDPHADVLNIPGPIARLLDRYAVDFGLVFVVSAGNRIRSIELDGFSSVDDVRRTPVGDRQDAALEHLVRTSGSRRIMPPAEATTALTVGAASADECGFVGHPAGHLELVAVGSPATFSAHGPGIRRQVKPEILAPGGRGVHTPTHRALLGQAVEFDVYTNTEGIRSCPPGVLTARAPSTQAGITSPYGYAIGTSVAAGLVSHSLGRLLDDLDRRIEDAADLRNDPVLLGAALRCLAVHSSTYGDWFETLARARGNRASYEHAAAASGYGLFAPERYLTDMGQNVVTMLHIGRLQSGYSDTFSIPIPSTISGVRATRLATVTTASLPPIDPARAAYTLGGVYAHVTDDSRSAFGLSGTLNSSRRVTSRGTVTHMAWRGVRAVTVDDGEALEVAVECTPRFRDGLMVQVPYAVAVTLAIEDVAIPLYQQIRTAIRQQSGIRVRATT